MHASRRSVLAGVAAGAMLGPLGWAGAAPLAPAAGAAQAARMPAAAAMPAASAPGTRLWVSRYNGPTNQDDSAAALAVSPDGGTVFVTGTSGGLTMAGFGTADYATVAYRAATGAALRTRRYKGPSDGNDSAASVAVSPDGGAVFVTGTSNGTAGSDATTVAYRAATGARLWTVRYHGPGASGASGNSVAVSPTSNTVYVTGDSIGSSTGSFDYATVAYDAATGRQLWARQYNGPGHGYDSAASVAVSPGGGTVLVTGASTGTRSGLDYATVAYRAATGARLWASRYRGHRYGATASSVAVGPGGQTVFITGSDSGTAAAIAYRAATGKRLWASRYDGPGDGRTEGFSVAVGPGGHTVYVAGFSDSYSSRTSVYATIAYHAATGARLWAASYHGPGGYGNDGAAMVAASPAGGAVFVTGTSFASASSTDFTTLAYRG